MIQARTRCPRPLFPLRAHGTEHSLTSKTCVTAVSWLPVRNFSARVRYKQLQGVAHLELNFALRWPCFSNAWLSNSVSRTACAKLMLRCTVGRAVAPSRSMPVIVICLSYLVHDGAGPSGSRSCQCLHIVMRRAYSADMGKERLRSCERGKSFMGLDMRTAAGRNVK